MTRSALIISALLTTAIVLSESDASAEDANAPFSATWRLLENRPDGNYLAELTIHNSRSSVLAGEWSLYFNSAAKLVADSVPAGFKLTHINGDFYVVRPTAVTKLLQPNEAYTITFQGQPWAINVSDAPSGLYLIEGPETDPAAKPILVAITASAFPDSKKLRRGASDEVDVVTSATRFAENERLQKLSAEQLIKVAPTPILVQSQDGIFSLGGNTKIIYDPAVANEAEYLAAALTDVLKDKPVSEPATNDQSETNAIRLRVADLKVGGESKQAGDEAYSITINPKGPIEIVGTDPAGVFYGVQTLRALLPIEAFRARANELKLGAIHVEDAPRFRYRGLHLDVARNFHSKGSVKKVLELMAFYKLNRFHCHLTDDEGWRIEIKELPELTEIGSRRGHTLDETDCLVPSQGSGPDPAKSPGSGFYTQADFVEILRYAQARHIAVVPEIDFPGHARAAIKSMEARYRRLSPTDPKAADEFLLTEPSDTSQYESVQMWRGNVVDVGRDATYRFLGVVFDELATMYKQADVPLTDIHLGGDEVPDGVWEKSSACEYLLPATVTGTARRGQLELYFLNRASKLLIDRKIQPACWEDCLLLETEHDKSAAESRRSAGKSTPTVYVWNNVWGWGREDAAYRLANAGFDVVLCNATNLYFDLACEKDPLELGYYWASFVGMRAPFEFVPLDVFKNARQTGMGQPVREDSFAGRERLTSDGVQHILGIQGELWSENLRSPRALEYMAFPRVLALAERAWAASPTWAETKDADNRQARLESDWNQFANRLGQRELPRLDYLCGGVGYRLPPPGVIVRDGQLLANIAFPGLEIRYTVDGSEPSATSPLYLSPVAFHEGAKFKSFDSRGRGSRIATVSADDSH